VTFDGSGSFDPDGGEIVRYDWNFGDGTIAPDAGPTPTHTDATDDTYTVTLSRDVEGDGVVVDIQPQTLT
jgi:hypothetical protein